MAPTFELATTVRDVDLFVVPVFTGRRLGPGADLIDDAIDRHARRVHARDRLRRQARRGARGADARPARRARGVARRCRRPGHVRSRRAAPRRGAHGAARVEGRRAWRRPCSTRSGAKSTAAPPPRRSPRASASGRTSSSVTRPTPSRRSWNARWSSDAAGSDVQAGLDRGTRIADRGCVGARPRQRARGREVARGGRRAGAQARARRPGSRSRCSRANSSNANGWAACSVSAWARSARRDSFVSSTRRRARADTLALVGKGVVFDSGGLSLKTASAAWRR